MRVFYIDMTGIDSKNELHELLQERLPLPDYCGSNLDAVHDVLTEYGSSWDIIFYNLSKIHGSMEVYVGKLQKMCADAVRQTPGLQIRFYN